MASDFTETTINLMYFLNLQGAHAFQVQTLGIPGHCLHLLFPPCLWGSGGIRLKERIRTVQPVPAC